MIQEMEKYARENRIPIMMSDGIEYLCHYIRKHRIKKILEIGSAIGYSAIRMALVDDDIEVTTIEKDERRYQVAFRNIEKFGLDHRIHIICDDALEVDLKDNNFDLIFIDASKGHNIDFFIKYKDYLKRDGVIITDNLSFHGLVEDESLIQTKNQRGIVRKIKKFIDFLDHNLEFKTEYIEVGDKISISKRVIG